MLLVLGAILGTEANLLPPVLGDEVSRPGSLATPPPALAGAGVAAAGDELVVDCEDFAAAKLESNGGADANGCGALAPLTANMPLVVPSPPDALLECALFV